jgi:hypothetical protein
MKDQLTLTIIELWHISRTALATQDSGRHSRMTYVKNELIKSYPKLIEGLSNKKIWLEIESVVF